MERKYNDVIEIYEEVFPNGDEQAATGYVLPDGKIIDITIDGEFGCHGYEFFRKAKLADWARSHQELQLHPRTIIDAIMNDIGGIEFSAVAFRQKCIRLPKESISTKQKNPLRGIISHLLEGDSILVEVLGTSEFAKYDSESNTVDSIMAKIDVYYASGKLPER
jgi:hypothetical protein